MLIAVVAAIAAGASFAAGGVLQQHAASDRPEREALSMRLIFDLAHDRTWWAGIGFAFLSYALESIALAFGPLVLVQPLIVCELLFALPISVRWRGMRMSWREWLGTASVAVGLGVGLASAAPGAGRTNAPALNWGAALGVAVILALATLAGGKRATGPARPSLYAASAGIVLGIQAALLKATTARFQTGAGAGLTSWEPWAMAVAAIVALVLVQSAYEAGPLAASMPVVDAVEPSVAIVFGLVLFDESVRGGLWLMGMAVGLLLLFAGIVVLDTSPVVQCLQWTQRRERRDQR